MAGGDRAPGLFKAILRSFPDSHRERCLFHKLQNVPAKLSSEAIEGLILKFHRVYCQADQDMVKLINEYPVTYSSPVLRFQKDFEPWIQ